MGEPPTDDTFVTAMRATPPEQEAAAQAAIAVLPRSDRYRVAGALASGGMGEVLVAHDVPLERDVVVKRMRTATPSAESITRFLREARIQGRLQHPAIVPVYDLAVDPDGRPFFAMKQLAGTTLADVLARNRAGAFTGWGRNQLLRAFVDVCLAIELAHTRNVLHRDLKPSNIALGDFGDVYVLDWGVARILGEDHPDTLDRLRAEGGAAPIPDEAAPPAPSGADDAWPLAAEPAAPTLPGAILGTPGYMAPEQLRGDPALGPAADIYALGCILFEILAGEPLHPRNAPLASTVMGADARPSARASAAAKGSDAGATAPGGGGDVSPELDTICVRATAMDPKERYPTARALAADVQRYLDGDRDLARRRELAAAYLADAREALARGDSAEARRDAMRAAGRALAVEPGSTEAAELVSHLVLSPPAEVPGELATELEIKTRRELRTHSRGALAAMAAFAAFFPVLAWIGIRDWAFFAAAAGLVGAGLALAVWSVISGRPSRTRAWVTMALGAVLVAMFARLIGPFLLPAGIAAVVIALAANHPYLNRRPALLFSSYLLAALGPWGLELVGVFASTYDVIPGEGYLLRTTVLEINPVAGQIGIALYVAAVILVTGLISLRIARQNERAREQVELQAWHLRQLVPGAAVRTVAGSP